MDPESELTEPLPLDRILLEKVWGGRALERTPGIALEASGPIGETWEVVDRDDHNSKVASGPFMGRSLRGLMSTDQKALLGRARTAADGTFPLLVKYLDAQKPLSLQVHPTAEVAGRVGGGHAAKTEAWYILAAEPESWIYLGLRPGVDASTFAQKANSEEVVDLLCSYEVEAGQFFFIPAGTVHAIGGGITLVEVQENSDSTFRLYDWGRIGLDGLPRETHVQEALLSIDFGAEVEGPVIPEHVPLETGSHATLIDCETFGMELFQTGSRLNLSTGDLAQALLILNGHGVLVHADNEYELATGSTWLLPAMVGDYRVEARGGNLELLRVETRE